ncbi:efflux RND transporter periplasmic adaptor subunit [Rubritalea sp.]|uniref:efflux RND transporter periplasmic adaptor subunit n=1 Tax=Rubritalea sp. TaxID=2109375 RepID=UPI003EF10165
MSENGIRQKVRPVIKLVIVIVVLVIGVGVMQMLMESPVKAPAEAKQSFVPKVRLLQVKAESLKVELSAQGMVEAVTQTMLLSEVGGAIEWVSPELKPGGYLKKGAVLLKVNKADYESRLAQALANVANAELQIEQERARAEQALRDWKKLGRGGEPSSLVRREPQLNSARAGLEAAKAAVVQAQRDLEKTELIAPYDCLVRSSHVDIGGYLTPAARVAELYEADKVQVRLPLSLEDVTYLPEGLVGVPVKLTVEIGQVKREWEGQIVRTEGVVDRATMTMMTVVEVTAADVGGMFELPPFGLFVEGHFLGNELVDVIRLPRMAVRDDSTVWLVNEDGALEIKNIKVERSERDFVYVVEGLSTGDNVIVSPIEVPVPGMPVEVEE